LGSVRTEQIKRTAKELIKRFPEKFSGNFDENKRMVRQLVEGGTPKVRNLIAGYITRSLAAQRDSAEAEAVEEEQEETVPS